MGEGEQIRGLFKTTGMSLSKAQKEGEQVEYGFYPFFGCFLVCAFVLFL